MNDEGIYEKRCCYPRHISEVIDEWLAIYGPTDRPDFDGLGKHILKGIYVTDDPCQYLSAGAAVKECKGKGLDMFIYILANG